MKSELALFLMRIEEIPDSVGRLVDRAVNSFTWRIARFAHGDEYTSWLSEFYCHLECTVLGIPARRADARFDLHRAWDLLKRPYGQNAPQALFDIATSGSEGGLRRIMITMADAYGEAYARQLIGVAVTFYLKDRTPAVLIADAREYITIHPDIVPVELTDGTPARIMANFPKVLEMHPFLMRHVRQTGR